MRVLLLLLVVAGAGAAGWWFFLREDEPAGPGPETPIERRGPVPPPPPAERDAPPAPVPDAWPPPPQIGREPDWRQKKITFKSNKGADFVDTVEKMGVLKLEPFEPADRARLEKAWFDGIIPGEETDLGRVETLLGEVGFDVQIRYPTIHYHKRPEPEPGDVAPPPPEDPRPH